MGEEIPDQTMNEIIMYCRVTQKKIQNQKKKKGQLQPAPLPPDTKEAAEHLAKIQKIKIHKNALELQGFDLEVLEAYPHNIAQGDVPCFLLKNPEKENSKEKMYKWFEMYDSIHEEINYEMEHKKLLKTPDYYQLVYE